MYLNWLTGIIDRCAGGILNLCDKHNFLKKIWILSNTLRILLYMFYAVVCEIRN